MSETDMPGYREQGESVEKAAERWVIVVEGEGATVRVIERDIHQAVHDEMCFCGKPWPQCETDDIRESVSTIDDDDNWATDEMRRRFSCRVAEYETAKVTLFMLWQQSQSATLQWSLDEQKKLYNALTNKARELQTENVALKGEVESERIERRAAIEGREQAMKEMYRQVEKCGLLDLEIERLKADRDILSAGLTKETEEIERLNLLLLAAKGDTIACENYRATIDRGNEQIAKLQRELGEQRDALQSQSAHHLGEIAMVKAELEEAWAECDRAREQRDSVWAEKKRYREGQFKAERERDELKQHNARLVEACRLYECRCSFGMGTLTTWTHTAECVAMKSAMKD